MVAAHRDHVKPETRNQKIRNDVVRWRSRDEAGPRVRRIARLSFSDPHPYIRVSGFRKARGFRLTDDAFAQKELTHG